MHCCLMLQLRDRVLHRQQGSYILTVEAGKQLLLYADSGAEASLQAELIDIQERWKATTLRLEEQKKQLAFLLKVCAAFFILIPIEIIFSMWIVS